MIPMLTEVSRFLRYLLTPETPVAAMQYQCAAAGATKAGLWIVLAVIVDVSFWGGGAYGNRDRIPGSSSQSAA